MDPIDVPFKVVGHRFRVWPAVLFLGGTSFFACAAIKMGATPAETAFPVICAALWWPLLRFLSSIRDSVSPEQADWLVAKVTRRNETARHKRITYRG